MESTTDRLFWTLTSIILGALLLTVSVKAFPSVVSSSMTPLNVISEKAPSKIDATVTEFPPGLNEKMFEQAKNISPITQMPNYNSQYFLKTRPQWNYPITLHVQQGKTYVMSAYITNLSQWNPNESLAPWNSPNNLQTEMSWASVDTNGWVQDAEQWNGHQYVRLDSRLDWQYGCIHPNQSGHLVAIYHADQTRDIGIGFGPGAGHVRDIKIAEFDNSDVMKPINNIQQQSGNWFDF